MMIKRRIIWEKWVDPLDPKNHNLDLPEEIPYEEKIKNNNIGPCIVGNKGIIPINEYNLPSNLYDFWVGHTNFDIDNDVSDILNSIKGVESLELFTRYRFRFAVGKAFKSINVKKRITKKLCEEYNIRDEDKIEANCVAPVLMGIDALKSHLSLKYRFWAIFIMPNGKMDCFGSNDENEVKEKILGYGELVNTITNSKKQEYAN